MRTAIVVSVLTVGCGEKVDMKPLEERITQLDKQVADLKAEVATVTILADKTPGEVKAEQALRDQVAGLTEAITGGEGAYWYCAAGHPWKPCPACPTNAITQCFRTVTRCERMASAEHQGCVLAPFAWCHDGETALGMCYFSRDYCEAVVKVGNARGHAFGTCKRVRPWAMTTRVRVTRPGGLLRDVIAGVASGPSVAMPTATGFSVRVQHRI